MNFTARIFEKKDHLKLLYSWLEARKMPKQPATFLPPFGLVIYESGVPICMGFLIECNNGMGIFSDFVSDISKSKALRNEAVIFMREMLSNYADERGIFFLTSFTSIPEHKKRLRKLGWVRIDDQLTQFGRFLKI